MRQMLHILLYTALIITIDILAVGAIGGLAKAIIEEHVNKPTQKVEQRVIVIQQIQPEPTRIPFRPISRYQRIGGDGWSTSDAPEWLTPIYVAHPIAIYPGEPIYPNPDRKE